MIYKSNEIYKEIDIYDGDTKIGEAEIEETSGMLARLNIFEPYQNKGYGTKVVEELTKEYGLTQLWVRADNKRAIHVYEKCGYELKDATMYLMVKMKENEV